MVCVVFCRSWLSMFAFRLLFVGFVLVALDVGLRSCLLLLLGCLQISLVWLLCGLLRIGCCVVFANCLIWL